jgi:hypothetical protein
MSGNGYAHSDYWRPVSELRQLLRTLCESGRHHFWPDSISLLEPTFDLSTLTSRQTTDVYLLGLAVANGGYLATFDTRIRPGAVPSGGLGALFVIPPET